jgi:hypothetical protein
MKQDGRDLTTQFRALAPPRRPISLQRWSVRRIVYAAAVVVGTVLAAAAMLVVVRPGEADAQGMPSCGTARVMVLLAQAVPTAAQVPCIAALPAGWTFGGVQILEDEGSFWLSSDRGGERAVEVRLRRPGGCSVDGAVAVPTDEVGTRRFEEPDRLPPDLRSTRTYVFDGGCVTYQFAFAGDTSTALMFDADIALAFQPRSLLVDKVRLDTGLRLCGLGAPCPGGS